MEDKNIQELNNFSEDLKVDSKEMGALLKLGKNMFTVKNPDDMIKGANSAGLNKTLGAFDLIILGVGAIIGSGIFTVVGIAAAGGPESVGAGPALIISMILASLFRKAAAIFFNPAFLALSVRTARCSAAARAFWPIASNTADISSVVIQFPFRCIF